MLYGKTTEQQVKKYEQKRLDKSIWKHKFAWFPITLPNGRKLWLECYWIRYIWQPYRYRNHKVTGGFYTREINRVKGE